MKTNNKNMKLIIFTFIIFISIFLSMFIKYNSKDVEPPKKSVLVKLD